MGISPEQFANLNESAIKPTSHWRSNKSATVFATIAPKETGIFRLLAWIFLLISAIYILAFLASQQNDPHVWIMHIKGYTVFVAMQITIMFLYGRLTQHIDSGPTLTAIESQLPSDGAVPIELKISQSGCITGADQGFIWFEDNIFFYKGRQTSFRINREDIPPLAELPKKFHPKRDVKKSKLQLFLPVNDRQLHVQFKLINPFEDFKTRKKTHAFQSQFANWIRSKETSLTESLLPPTEVHPALIRQGWSKIEPLFGAGLLAAINIILFAAGVAFWKSTPNLIVLSQFSIFVNFTMLILSLRSAFQSWKSAGVREQIQILDAKSII